MRKDNSILKTNEETFYMSFYSILLCHIKYNKQDLFEMLIMVAQIIFWGIKNIDIWLKEGKQL